MSLKRDAGPGCYLSSQTFFFSSRRLHTICGRDWSSDVCSSDLLDNILGLLIISPSDVTIYSLMPKSNPTALLFCGNSCISSSTNTDTKYLSVLALDIVQEVILPLKHLLLANLINPSLGSFILLFLISMLLFTFCVLYDCLGFFLVLNFGNPTSFSPFFIRLKKF